MAFPLICLVEPVASSESRRTKSGLALLAIGVFKVMKSTALVGLGITLVHYRNQDLGEIASHWITSVSPGHHFLDGLISQLSSISERTIKELAIGAFTLAALFLIEGVGLCLRKRWAE